TSTAWRGRRRVTRASRKSWRRPTSASPTCRGLHPAPTWETRPPPPSRCARKSRCARRWRREAPKTQGSWRARGPPPPPPAPRRLALLEDEIGHTQAGRDRLAQALATIEHIDARREAARVHRDLGLLVFKTGDRPKALEHQRRSLEAWRAERKANPDDPDVLRELYL